MNKKDLPAEVYEFIRSKIIGFTLLPGVRISEKDIAVEMGISRTPVREALIRLEGHGLVQFAHNRGFAVRQFTVKEVKDIYILRETLELLAIKLTMQNQEEVSQDALSELLNSYPGLIATGNRDAFNKADEDFHRYITEFSHNEPLKAQLDSLHDQLAVLRRIAHLYSQSWRLTYEDETYQQHREIYQYMIKGDLAKAKRAMSRHIKASMVSVVEALQKKL